MATTRKSIAILILAFIFVSSCDEAPTRSGGGKPRVNFPNSVGMLWKYQVYDSLTQTTDIVWLSITDTLTIRSNEFFTQRNEKRFSAITLAKATSATATFDAQYLHVVGDTLEIFNDTTGLLASERIVFPLELGNEWSGPSDNDTSRVTLVGEIEVPAGRFSGSARIDRSWNTDFEGGGSHSQTWIAPDVGVVYRHNLSQVSDGVNLTVTKNEVWKLIEYDVTTFELHELPNKVGSEWVYESVDSIPAGRDSVIVDYDTVTVTIVASGQFESGAPFTKWRYVSRSETDTLFVVSNEERLSFQGDTTFNPIWDIYYDFPLAVGRTWGLVFIAPVPEALDKEPVATPAQNFTSTFHTRASGGAFNDYWTQEDWLAPGVGIIKSRRWQVGFIPWMNRTRTLIAYTLVN